MISDFQNDLFKEKQFIGKNSIRMNYL